MKHSLPNDKISRDRRERAKNAEKQSAQAKRARYEDAIVSDAFLKVKKKFLLGAIAKSAICGISFGLLAVGILLLVIKTSGIPFNFIWYIVAGVGCALVCGVITFLFLKPGNRRVAKTVDEEYGLKEQVQTSLAFSRDSGDVVLMQRERAESAIGALPRRKIKFSKIWQYIVIIFVAVALAVAGILVPGKKSKGSTGEGGEPGITVDRSHIVKVEQLIAYIKSENEKRKVEEAKKNETGKNGTPERYIGEELTQAVVDELTEFKSSLEKALEENVEVTRSEVLPVLQKINGIFTAETNYVQISEVIAGKVSEAGVDASFGEMIRAGGDAYRIYLLRDESEMDEYHADMEMNANTSINRQSAKFLEWLMPSDPDEGDDQPVNPGEENTPTAEELAAQIREEYDKITDIYNKLSVTDGLISSVVSELREESFILPNKQIVSFFDLLSADLQKSQNEFISTLKARFGSQDEQIYNPKGLKDILEEYLQANADKGADSVSDFENILEELDGFKGNASLNVADFVTRLAYGNGNEADSQSGEEKVSETLAKQSYYMALDRHISNSIRSAFRMELIEPDKIEDEEQGGNQGNTGDNNPSTGGNTSGSGDLTFPGNDYIYDWLEDKVKPYGELISDYVARVNEFLTENADTLTEKQKQMIQAYINALYGNSAEN